MRKLLTLSAAAALAVAFGFAAGPASADKQTNCTNTGTDAFGCNIIKGAKLQSDHALYGRGDDTAIFCGVKLDQFVEPWTLHVSATADANGTVTITFNDGDTMNFKLLAGTSFSTTQAFGGVPGVTDGSPGSDGVDDLVRITGDSGIIEMLASAEVRARATDPFDEAADGGSAEPDNFCLSAPGDKGAGVAPVSTFPNTTP